MRQRALREPLGPLSIPPGFSCFGRLYRAVTQEPTESVPVVLYVYGGPGVQVSALGWLCSVCLQDATRCTPREARSSS
jgi:hypothetical protein